MEHLKPLVDYLKARQHLHRGEEEKAAEAVEQAFGSDEPNLFIRQNLAVILDESKAGGTIVLDGIFREMKWVQRRTATSRKSPG